MKLYILYNKVTKKMVADMERGTSFKGYLLGCVDPKTDGNDYLQLIVSGNKKKLQEWWDWAVRSEDVYMDEEFHFEEKDIEIREMEMVI